MAGAVLGVGLLLSDFEPIKRLAVEIAVGVATYVSFLALIDRAAVRLGQSFIADMRQIIRPA
jgi:hypothetical protein